MARSAAARSGPPLVLIAVIGVAILSPYPQVIAGVRGFVGALLSGQLPTLARQEAPPVAAAPAVPPPPPSAAAARLIPLPAADRAPVAALTAALPTRGRGPKTGYTRDQFGQAWTDAAGGVLWSGNGCSTREDILARDLDNITKRDACVVLTGTLLDPYTGTTVPFTKANAIAVPIDHVIPLSYAWQLGANAWPATKRVEVANDPLNLVATTKGPNEAKSDSLVASWLPPHKPIRCAYAARIAMVATKYALPVTPADRDVLTSQCS